MLTMLQQRQPASRTGYARAIRRYCSPTAAPSDPHDQQAEDLSAEAQA
jgi:hypothetical protein